MSAPGRAESRDGRPIEVPPQPAAPSTQVAGQPLPPVPVLAPHVDALGTVSPERSRIKVLYVGGLGRSGSTLLDCIMGQLPGFVSVGELREVWSLGVRANRLCGCGRPFRSCPFWNAVGEQAFGGWDNLDVERMVALARRVDRHSRWPFLVWPGIAPHLRPLLTEYTDALSRLYLAIHDVAQSRVVIDSSKAPSTAFVLRNVQGLDLRIAHLIRDPHGVAYSWTKTVLRPDTARRVYMQRYHPVRTALRWNTRNALMEILGRLGVPEVRVRYEQVVASPRAVVGRVADALDESITEEQLDFIREREVLLAPNHTVMGNPMRMRHGPTSLRLDTEWRRAMHPAVRGAVTLVTWPMARRYGYER